MDPVAALTVALVVVVGLAIVVVVAAGRCRRQDEATIRYLTRAVVAKNAVDLDRAEMVPVRTKPNPVQPDNRFSVVDVGV
jgi:hypothetical protein